LAAGCAGSAPTSGKSASASASLGSTAHAGIGTGEIRGTVTDQELVPIRGARVAVVGGDGPNGSAEIPLDTNAAGEFSATGLSVGRYIVYVSKPAYEPLPPKAVNLAAEPLVLKFVLVPLPASVAYHESMNRKSLYNTFCTTQIVAVNPICWTFGLGENKNVVDPNDKTVYNSSVEKKVRDAETLPLSTLLMESTWKDNPGVCKIGTFAQITSPQFGANAIYANVPYTGKSAQFYWTNLPNNVSSPVRIRVDRDGNDPNAMNSKARLEANGNDPIKADGAWKFYWNSYPKGMTGAPVGDPSCAFDVHVDLWFSFWFLEPAPKDWTALQA
jgi:hypothetical protein